MKPLHNSIKPLSILLLTTLKKVIIIIIIIVIDMLKQDKMIF